MPLQKMRVVCVFFETPLPDVKTLPNFAEACLRFTPQIAVGSGVGGGWVFLEVGACASLYSEAGVLARLQVMLMRFSLKARMATADDVPTALALAVFGVKQKGLLPVQCLRFYAHPFSGGDAFLEVVQNLKRLGVHTVAQFFELPVKALASRFGKAALLARHALENADGVAWPRFVPAQKICERLEVDSEFLLTEWQHLLFPLKKLCDRAASRLKGLGRLAGALELRIEQQRYSTVLEPVRTVTLDFAFPQGSALSLLQLIKERCDFLLQRQPLEAPVACLELTITQSVPSAGSQKDLFSNKEEELEGFRSLVSRLVDKLGLEKVFKAEPLESYLPERSWKKTLEEPGEVVPVVPLRPLRVLPKPVPLRRIENYLVHPQKRWLAENFSDPERIAAEWWLGHEERDYYRVRTASGEELWVYKTASAPEYFLHGLFD